MSNHESGDPWIVGERTIDGQPLIVRMREMLPSHVAQRDYPYQISILVKYESTTPGPPSEENHEQMRVMEERLDQLEAAGTAYMMVTVTGNDEKEWFWYARDVEAFMGNFNDALKGLPSLPLEIEGSDDPEWNAFAAFVATRGEAS